MGLNDIPRLKLGHLPTPLDEAPRLAAELGLRRLLIKRDDLTGLALGGNKVRKLEFLLAEALGQRADVILTDGGPQSNHARLTAAAARTLGLDAILFLGGPRFDQFNGNLLLDILFGADIRFMPDARVPEMEAAMAREAEELRRSGRRPYVIPIGGSTPLGALGYVTAMQELADQLGNDREPMIVLAVGSGGTIAGSLLGTRLFLPGAQVVGISVSRKSRPLRGIARDIAQGSAELIGKSESFDLEAIEINDSYIGEGYGIPTDRGIEAMLVAARTEGLVLDPVYTGKAMSGLIDLARKDLIDRDRTTVFLHTGGAPALFACEPQFRRFARYSDFEPSRSGV